ncbi:probable tubulin polyglutamylase ttll-15 [Sycon ciliatum]|uniref:probable tubulin polyglutamylase ttll-15 n=1 Tax=Sycon ciliatum TaxID=27933 RepID=UPI0031F69703
MVFHRLRGTGNASEHGDQSLLGIMERSPLHLRMMRAPRGCNATTCLLLCGALTALYILYSLHSLQELVKTQQRSLVHHIEQLKHVQQPAASHHGGEVHGGEQHRTADDGGKGDVYLPNTRSIPTLWLMSKSVHHLNHVITVFERAGFQIVRQPAPRTDVLWSYEYPFSGGWRAAIHKMRHPQKVNHFPGSGFITNKMSLSTSKIKYLPKAYKIPSDVDALKKSAKSNPKKMFVMKSNDHRGIKIKTLADMDLSEKGRLNFVQEFVDKPYLVDGRKFDIGVYVVIASINPLRVYMYEEEVLLRFCTVDYHPLDVTNVEKYVIGDKYTPTSQIPSLKHSIIDLQYSMKQTLNVHLKSKGFDPEKLWSQIRTSIREVTTSKEKEIKVAMATYPDPKVFFEMVRFDFVIDDLLNLWLMEVNMSPNLSSSIHPENAIMYEQVIFNTLALVGAAHYVAGPLVKLNDQERAMTVRKSDVIVPVDECSQDKCKHCEAEICALCQQCMSDEQLGIFKQAFQEQVHRRNFVRLFPIPPSGKTDPGLSHDVPSVPNTVMRHWYAAKCRHSPAWCM